MVKRFLGFLFGWVVPLKKFLKDLFDPELNADFFDSIDHDYHP